MYTICDAESLHNLEQRLSEYIVPQTKKKLPLERC
jgi:hypothetical protein